MKLLNTLFLLFATLLIFTMICTTTSYAASTENTMSFSPSQTQQIEKIVHDYLLDNPQLMLEIIKKLQNKQRQEMEARVIKAVYENALAIFNAPESPSLGNKKGNIHLVEFFDYQCTHCKEVSHIITQLIQNNPNLRVILKELPIFPNSEYAARAALAAQIQGKFIEINEALLKTETPLTPDKVLQLASSVGLNTTQLQKDMQTEAIKNEIAQNMRLAETMGLSGTPSFVVASMNNNKDRPDKVFFLSGMAKLETLQNMIDKAKG